MVASKTIWDQLEALLANRDRSSCGTNNLAELITMDIIKHQGGS